MPERRITASAVPSRKPSAMTAAVSHRVGSSRPRPRLWAYAQALTAHPAFGAHLDLDGLARRHHVHCRGEEAAGAAMQIVDWAAYAAESAFG